MENKINIAEILRDMPEGTKLYSPLFGKCEYMGWEIFVMTNGKLITFRITMKIIVYFRTIA